MNPNFMQLMSMMRSGQNPSVVAQKMLQQNPQFNAIMNQVKNSGMSMKDFTMQYAKQNGIDINSLMQQFGMGNK